jgi:CheY-like chemotaxis protein
MGHDLATACDGIEGIELARTFRPHVILMDIGLPEMNGHETARASVSNPGEKQSPDRRHRLWSGGRPLAGFDYHLVKALSFAELHSKCCSVKRNLC